MSIYLLIILLSLLVLHIHLRYSRTGRLLHAVPGLPSIPLLGNVLQFGFNISQVGLWKFIQICLTRYYPVAKIWFLTFRMFGICHPDDAKILLLDKENITKGSPYKYMEPILGKGLITSTGDQYYSRKKLITPAFNPSSFEKLIKITNEQGKDFIQELRDAGDETIQNPKRILPRVTLNAICEWCMGVDLRTIKKETTEYQHSIEASTEIVMYRVFRPYINDWIIKFLHVWRELDNAVKTIHHFVNKLINNRRNYHESTDHKYLAINGTDVKDYSKTDVLKERQKNFCLLDYLLSAERDGLIDEKGIIEEINTIIGAGFDTSATVMLYTLMLLAENKVAQDLARSEVLKLIEENGNGFTVEQLKKLDYLDRCIKESMRLFPAIPFVVRKLQKDLYLRDYIIPAGSDAVISFYNIHRNPDFWPNPEQFDPDRFLPEQVKTRHPFAYLPFSGGTRSCIGQKFAMMQMKTLIAIILSNFKLEPIGKTNNIIFKMDFVLSPSHPVHVKFIKLRTKC